MDTKRMIMEAQRQSRKRVVTEEMKAIIHAKVDSDRAFMTMVVAVGVLMSVMFGVMLRWEGKLAHDAVVNQEIGQ